MHTKIQTLAMLRLTSSNLHRELDSSPLVARLLSDSVQLDHYADFLSRMKNLYCVFSSPLKLYWNELGLNYSYWDRSEALEEDLRYLHLHRGILPPDCLALVPCPSPRTLSEAWGLAYVLEGSCLGGHVILKRMSKSLGVENSRGGSFLAARGSDVASNWKTYCRKVEQFGESSPLEVAPMCTYVGRVFNAFIQVMTNAEVSPKGDSMLQ